MPENLEKVDDVVVTGKELTKQNYTGATDYKKLYPDALGNAKSPPPLSKLLTITKDAVQKAKEATTDAGKISRIDKLLESAKKAAEVNVDMRIADQEDELVKDLKV